MSGEYDETVSFALMGKLLTELEERCESESHFSLAELLDSFSLPVANIELLRELTIHHYRILKEKYSDLTPDIYIAQYPQHADLIQDIEDLLSPSRIGAALLALSDSANQFPTNPDSYPKSAGVPEFRGGPLELLPAAMQRTLHGHMHPATYSDGEQIVTEGEEGDQLFICCAGAARVTVQKENGKTLKIGRIVPGQVIGEMALMGVARRTATVTAEGHVDVLTLSKEAFHELLKQHQEFSNVITTIIGERLGNQLRDALSSVTLEGYRISRRLGRGGMAVVYDAISEESGERVALKMMSHRLSVDELAREWFNREAELIASFQHPNIPRLLERFDAFATAFMAIEYIEGLPLSTILKQHGPFDELSALRVLANLAGALEYAHSQGIVHRDVKPANCMISDTGEVKLMDFGLSVPFFSGKDARRVIAGTPAYMSPEQFRGEVNPESDWFSLGCVIFELVTGQRLLNPHNLLALASRFDNWDADEIIQQLPNGMKEMQAHLRALLSLDPTRRTPLLPQLQQYRTTLDVSRWECFKKFE